MRASSYDNVTVHSGGTLAGTGSFFNDVVVVKSGGTLSPGDKTVAGTLTIKGDLTLEDGATANFKLTAPGEGGTGNDLVKLNSYTYANCLTREIIT